MSEILNANPTIRNASDLPSRRRQLSSQTSSKSPLGLFASTVPASAYLPDPFSPATSDPENSDSEDDSVDPIDEQEIYGIASSFSYLNLTFYPPYLHVLIVSPPIHLKLILSSAIHLTSTVDLIAPIADPEHPLTLGSLSVVNLPDIHLTSSSTTSLTTLTVLVTPTITHCSLATVIGLGVRVRLEQALPPRFRVDVRIKEGTHSTAEQVNRQLGDKERVAAALENGTLVGVLRKMLEGCE